MTAVVGFQQQVEIALVAGKKDQPKIATGLVVSVV